MTTFAIELNDAGVAVARGRTLLPESPGYALVEGDRLVVGAEARQAARLKPRHVQNRFWDQLSLDPLSQPGLRAQTHADVACAHLGHVWKTIQAECDGVIFAVPGSFTRTQLGLLLGIAQSCAIPVVGMVDAAVAAVPAPEAGTRLVHVDLQLHRAVITHLRAGPVLARSGVETSARIGLGSLHDHALALIADVFVRQTRFDPLHRAHTEQQLYDLLPECLARLRGEERVAIQMNAGSKTHRVHLQREDYLKSMHGHYETLTVQLDAVRSPGESLAVALSARASAPPGLADALRALPDCRVIELGPGAAVFGALAREAQIRSPEGGIRLLSALDGEARGGAAAAEPQAQRAPCESPTHLLCGDVAHALGTAPLEICAGERGEPQVTQVGAPGAAGACAVFRDGGEVVVEAPPESGALLNGRSIDGRARLRTGDRIRLANGDEIRLIAVRAGRGA